MKILRFIPTKKTRPSTPSRLMGVEYLDLSFHLSVYFRRDLGIYPGDADDTKRGYLVYMLSSG